MVGYALAEDAIGMARFREKYAPLMSGEADKLAFDTASKPRAANSGDFAAIAKMAASVDTLDGFLREMKTRFPDATARAPLADPEPDRLAAEDRRRAQRAGNPAADHDAAANPLDSGLLKPATFGRETVPEGP